MNHWLDQRVYFLLGLITGAALCWLLRPKPRDEAEDLYEAIETWVASKNLSQEAQP